MSILKRTPPPPVPFCVVALEAWGMVRTLRVPEARIPELAPFGWQVVIRDSEMTEPPTMNMTLLSGPQRVADKDEGDPA